MRENFQLIQKFEHFLNVNVYTVKYTWNVHTGNYSFLPEYSEYFAQSIPSFPHAARVYIDHAHWRFFGSQSRSEIHATKYDVNLLLGLKSWEQTHDARSSGRSSPDTLPFWACESSRLSQLLPGLQFPPLVQNASTRDETMRGLGRAPGVAAVSMLTERDWRLLSMELVLGKIWNCTWGMGFAPHTPQTRSQWQQSDHFWIRSMGVLSRTYPTP